jgi:nucleoside-diphosphate-sugar epimerase
VNTVLVVGASGLVGGGAATAFAAAGWDVITVSRRQMHAHRTDANPAQQITHVALDINDPAASRSVLTQLPPITHLVYAAVRESSDLVAGWRDTEQMQINLQMLRNILEPLVRTNHLRHVTLLQGTKAYGAHLHPISIPARESEPRDPHPNFYWLQEDFIREHSTNHGYTWTIFRPPLIVGGNVGVAMNVIGPIGVYAAMRAAEGLPFTFPGGPSYITQAVDCRLVGKAAVWAAEAPSAAREIFNLSNGEVFEWRNCWPAIAATLGVSVGDDEQISLADYVDERADLWKEIAIRHQLVQPELKRVLGQSHKYADFHFAYGARKAPPPALMSTVKIRRAGFGGAIDTETSLRHWFRHLIEQNIIPYNG